MKYRITPRGILIQDQKVLFACYQVKERLVYALPGGKQEIGESIKACLIREFKEELSLDVEVGKLVLIKEFIHAHNDVAGWENGIHQVELIFEVSATQLFYHANLGQRPDNNMLGAQLLSKAKMKTVSYFPEQEPSWFFKDKAQIPYLLDS